jgi:hypothetical protein
VSFIDSVITGLATGLGSAVGTYIATRHVVSRMEKMEKRIKKVVTIYKSVNHNRYE